MLLSSALKLLSGTDVLEKDTEMMTALSEQVSVNLSTSMHPRNLS